MKSNNHTEQGNVLIYILGAIFLIGILTVMVRGSNTPGAGIDEETLMIKVAEVQAYGQELEQAIQLVFQNGHSESDIRFAHPDAPSAYGDITDTPTRQVFHRNGGAATYREPPTSIQTTPTPWIFTGYNRVQGLGSNGNADLLAILSNVTEDFCLRMNELNDIDNPSDAPPADPDNFELTQPFTGTFDNTELLGPATTALQSKREGCVEGGGTPAADTFHYYRALLAR